MKILIVEDEEKLAEAIKAGLKECGFTSDIIGTGMRAESRILVCKDDYDLIILDLMLPEKNGFEVCKSVRESGVTTPILILTARTAIEDKVLALNSGADDYLVKPFAFSELIARIQALLRRPHEVLPQILSIKDITLNPQTREVKRGDKVIALSLKEFELLQLLMRQPNQVMGREDIFVHLWDFADTSSSNVIDAHVKNLRKKLNEGYAGDILETVRGVGYTIKA
jgi:DNA-binding response OmpR family regulator